MLLTGVAWFAGDLNSGLLYAHRGPLVQLLLTYPAGRVRSHAVAALVGIAYVDGLVADLARNDAATVALFGTVVLAAAWRRHTSAGVLRSARTSALAGCVIATAPLLVSSVTRFAGGDPGLTAVWGFDLAVMLVAAGLTADLRWGAWTSAAVTDLVIELGDRRAPRSLRAALARILDDPGLEVAYRAEGGWLDETGTPGALPGADDSRVVTLVHENGEAVAALIHDPTALTDPVLAASVASVARLALANARMQAEIAARVAEVSRSRHRLVEAGDEERQALRDELGTGAESRLEAVALQLAVLSEHDGGEAVRGLATELDGALADLRRFAQGIYPSALTDEGLRAALVELGARSNVPVALSAPEKRFAPSVEAAAYFVCAEALANVAKYADATQVGIDLSATDLELVVRVADDGAGGADPAHGSGLRGLVDRVEALGGALRVDSRRWEGTCVEARLPLPSVEAP